MILTCLCTMYYVKICVYDVLKKLSCFTVIWLDELFVGRAMSMRSLIWSLRSTKIWRKNLDSIGEKYLKGCSSLIEENPRYYLLHLWADFEYSTFFLLLLLLPPPSAFYSSAPFASFLVWDCSRKTQRERCGTTSRLPLFFGLLLVFILFFLFSF